MDNNDNKNQLLPKCSFCGRPHDDKRQFIQGSIPGTFICDDCIELCYEIIKEDNSKNKVKNLEVNTSIKPSDIKDFLDNYVVGQDEAKKSIAVAVYNHYKRINDKDNDVEIQKSNILFIGPTGSGKTYMAENLAKFLGVPFAIADATSLTEAGYVGEDVENILLRLIEAADGDIKKAEIGIVYVDEIDKITKKNENMSITRDVSGEGVQQALLKIMEGTIANVPPQGGRKHPQQEYIKINTKNILFICGGAFSGLEKIIARRLNKSSIGFNSEIKEKHNIKYDEYIDKCEVEDLIHYGLIPEFIGRLPIIATLKTLNVVALKDILLKPKNALIKQYKKLFYLDHIDLVFDDEAIEVIAKKASDMKLGARGLRSIIEKVMKDIMYEAPSIDKLEKVLITKGCIEGMEKPIYVLEDNNIISLNKKAS